MTDNTVDILGRKVSGKGYLIDDAYNIVKYDEQGNAKIMFKFWEVLHQEPPKFFDFTEWDIRWIKGRLGHDVTKNPAHDDEFDLDGRRINTLGYLIAANGNIVN